METVTISLSKEYKEFVEAQVAEGGFGSASRFFGFLLRAERRRKAEEQLLQLVKEAEASGLATPMTEKHWKNLKQRVWDRNTRSKGSARGQSRQKNRRRVGSG